MFDFNEIAEKVGNVNIYENRNVIEEKIERIICAARSAPVKKANAYRLIVNNDKNVLNTFKDFSSFGFNEEGEYAGPPLAVIVCYDRNFYEDSPAEEAVIDSTLVTSFMRMEGISIGLGTTLIDDFDKKKIRQTMHLPENWIPFSIIYFGLTGEEIKESDEKNQMKETVFYNGLKY